MNLYFYKKKKVMTYIIIAIILIVGLTVGVGCKISSEKNKNKTEIFNKPTDTTQEILSKEEIEKKLKKLSKSNPKNLENIGAMCYEMAMPPERAEYICPICGEKTLYSNFNYSQLITWELQQMRTLSENLEAINAKLDESQFCRSCSPDIEEPEICLIVKLKDTDEHKTCKINIEDLKILNEFVAGEIIHKDDFDAETPLNFHILRISELLGIDGAKYIK